MRVIDLSHLLDTDIPVYPGDTAVLLEQYKTRERDGYTAFELHTGLHAGTHIDMPMHMTKDPRTAAGFDPALFIGEGVLFDVRGENPIKMKQEYTSVSLRDKIVLLWTGFDCRFYEPEYFTGYPSVTTELAQFLLESGIKLLGTDTPAPDYAPFPVHLMLLGGGVFLLENLTNLEALAGLDSFTVCALPLKLAAEASPVRAAAVVY